MGIITDIVAQTDLKALEPEIKLLNAQLKKLNQSFTWQQTLLRALLTGFGTTIGATVLVALIVWITQGLTGLPLFGSFFTFLSSHIAK